MWKFYSGLVLLGLVCIKNGYCLQCWQCSSDIDPDCADRFNHTLEYRYRPGGSGPYYQAQQGYNPNPSYNSRDYNRDDNNRGGYNNRDYNRDFNNRDYNNQGRNYDQQGRYDPQGNINNRDNYNNNPQDRDRNYDSQRRNFDSQGYYNPPQGRPYDTNNRPYDPNFPRDYNRPISDVGGARLINCDDSEARLRQMRSVCLKKVQRIDYGLITVIRRCKQIPLDKPVGTCYDAVSRGVTLDFCEYCDYDGCNSAHSVKINMLLASLLPLAIFLVFNS